MVGVGLGCLACRGVLTNRLCPAVPHVATSLRGGSRELSHCSVKVWQLHVLIQVLQSLDKCSQDSQHPPRVNLCNDKCSGWLQLEETNGDKYDKYT